ncbi:MAG: integrase domain-containing protein, partial [Gammaproteobacteria bacterium]|nr:integrase domain-containing protein [Gammaproteobacteria bacterium]
QGSWTKGGIARLIPITRPSQRDCLDRIKLLVGKESLIPKDLTYRQQRERYDYLTHKNGFHKLHGLRHAYAQRRYEVITNEMTKGYGWKPPIAGGPTPSQLNAYEKHIDYQARLMISQELGHSRVEIIRSYCG